MTKHEFLNHLKTALSALPQEEAQKTIDYYAELIDDAMEDGGEEAAVIANLGSVADIAEKIIHETPAREFTLENLKKRNWNAVTLTLLALGSPVWIALLLAAAAMVFSLYVSVWSIVFSLFATTAALALSGVVFLVASPFLLPVAASKAMLLFGMALVSAGAAIFLFYLSVYCAKQLIRLTGFICRKIKHFFMKQGGASDEIQ